MRTYVLTPDGKVTQVLDGYKPDAEQVAACERVCVAHDAVDLLPMLGVTS